jgi:glycosyltransferase involved in cell wall biosynthesis
MKVLHITEDHSLQNTGITSAIDSLLRQLQGKNEQQIACIGPETVPVPEWVGVHLFSSRGPAKAWRFAAGQRWRLHEAVAQADIIHIHGIWMWIQWAAAQEAARTSRPFLLTTHGMLEPWIGSRQHLLHRLKKSLYWRMLAYPAFKRADLIHAITVKEAENLKSAFPGKRIEIVPNGLNLDEIDRILALQEEPKPGERPYFLFLGRLHPVKAIHLIIQAFTRLPDQRFILKIAGPIEAREKRYAEHLQRLVTQAGLEKRVQFLGRVQGPEKWRLYQNAWAFCLPSFSEAFSMANLEAAACATPVITSFESGVIQDWAKNGGILIHPEEEEIFCGLQQAASWTLAEREERGRCLRRLAENHFDWQHITPQWIAIYQKLAGR